MPKQIFEAKKVIELLKKDNVRAIRIKKNGENTKFKVRCAKYLYTFVSTEQKTTDDIRKAIPQNVQVLEIVKKVPKAE